MRPNQFAGFSLLADPDSEHLFDTSRAHELFPFVFLEHEAVFGARHFGFELIAPIDGPPGETALGAPDQIVPSAPPFTNRAPIRQKG